MAGLVIFLTHIGEEMLKTFLFRGISQLSADLEILTIVSLHGMFSVAMSLFSFVIIYQGHERKEINLCLAAFIDPPLEN